MNVVLRGGLAVGIELGWILSRKIRKGSAMDKIVALFAHLDGTQDNLKYRNFSGRCSIKQEVLKSQSQVLL